MKDNAKSVAGLGVQMHPLVRLVMYSCVHNCTSPSSSGMQQQQPGTVQFGLPAILNNSLATSASVPVATIITCVMNVLT